MSAFIPHTPGNPPANNDRIIPADDFSPPLSVAEWKLRMRVDDNVSPARSTEILKRAMLDIIDELQPWRAKQTTTTLADGRDSARYLQAVWQRAKAYELEQYRDIDTTDSGSRRAEGIESRIDTALQRSREALRRLMGRGRATIVLI